MALSSALSAVATGFWLAERNPVMAPLLVDGTTRWPNTESGRQLARR